MTSGSTNKRSFLSHLGKLVVWVIGVLFVALVGGLASPFGNRVDWAVPPKIVDPSLRGYLGTIQDNLLQAQSRRLELLDVVRKIDRCAMRPRTAIQRAEEIAAERNRAVHAIEKVPAPDSGREIQRLFIEAFTSAVQADGAYIAWLREVEASDPHAMPCHYENLPEYRTFVSDSAAASDSKRALARSVNPKLALYNYTPSSWSEYNF